MKHTTQLNYLRKRKKILSFFLSLHLPSFLCISLEVVPIFFFQLDPFLDGEKSSSYGKPTVLCKGGIICTFGVFNERKVFVYFLYSHSGIWPPSRDISTEIGLLSREPKHLSKKPPDFKLWI